MLAKLRPLRAGLLLAVSLAASSCGWLGPSAAPGAHVTTLPSAAARVAGAVSFLVTAPTYLPKSLDPAPAASVVNLLGKSSGPSQRAVVFDYRASKGHSASLEISESKEPQHFTGGGVQQISVGGHAAQFRVLEGGLALVFQDRGVTLELLSTNVSRSDLLHIARSMLSQST